MIILVGASGTGKSTYTLNNYPDFVVCSADHYMMEDGVYRWTPEKIGPAHSRCFAHATKSLVGGRSVVIDNTNTRAKERNRYLDLAEELGEAVEIHVLPWKKEFISRNVHGVDAETVQKQLDRIDLDFGWVYDAQGNKIREIL